MSAIARESPAPSMARPKRVQPPSSARGPRSNSNATALKASRSGGIPTVAWQGEATGERFLFVRGSTAMLPGQEEALRAFAKTIPAGFRLMVHGMASEEGPAALNENLSRARAERVINLLAAAGVPASRVDVILVHGEVAGDRKSHRAAVVDLTPPVRGPAPEPERPKPEPATPHLVVDALKQIVPSDLGVKFEEEVGTRYIDLGPISIRAKVKFGFDGSIQGDWSGPKVRQILDVGKGKAKIELTKSIQTELGKFSLKGASDGKIGIEWGSKGSPLYDLVGDHLTFDIGSPLGQILIGKKPKDTDVVDFNVGGAWEFDLSRWGQGEYRFDLGLPQGMSIPGKATMKGGVGIRPNLAWWVKRAATAAGTEVVAGAAAADVAVGVALPVGMVAFVGYGVYELNEAHRRGREQAIRECFADGYAQVLAQLTNVHPLVPGGAELLSVPWEELYSAAMASYVQNGGLGFREVELARRAGRAAAAQEVLKLIEADPSALSRLGIEHRRLYGDSEMQRAPRYRAILRAQSKAGDVMGIGLRP